jgi:CubicO group peptidase (beta-lactamase class C family)
VKLGVKRRLLSAAVALLFGAAPGTAPAQSRQATVDTALAPAIRDYARAHGFSGAVLVERRGRTVYRGDFGLADRAFGVPVARDTRFWVASITKAFTAVLVLQLADEGRLDLRAPIRRYLPDYAGAGADRVTVHQLLTHTSGLDQYDRVASYEEAVAKGMEVYQLPHAPAELLARYASGRLVREPGAAFDYNNADYVVLGAIVERVTGASYEEALRRRILAPLGLTATGVLRAQAMVPRLAPTYMRADSAAPLLRDLPVYPENWGAAGAMYSTADDLLAFARALYGGRLLRPATLRAMLTPGLGEYGYGLWVATQDIAGAKHRYAQRPGRIMGANVLLLRYPDDDVTVVILGNTNLADTDAFGYFIGRTVIR